MERRKREIEPEVIESIAIQTFEEGTEGVCVTKDELATALNANMVYKLGHRPVEGQFEDLWRRLRE